MNNYSRVLYWALKKQTVAKNSIYVEKFDTEAGLGIGECPNFLIT